MVAMKMAAPGLAHFETHYAELSEKPFYPRLLKYITAGPVVAMVWEGLDVVKQGRLMLGATNPLASNPGTIRGDYSLDLGRYLTYTIHKIKDDNFFSRNIIHGSDSLDAAKKEIGL